MNPCSSILSQLLLNNCPPGPLESGPLQAEADQLKSKILALRKKLQQYEDLLQKHETVLSIARRVPLDVWGVIFSFVLPDCSTREDRQGMTNLSLVCKDWQQAAQFAHRFSSHLRLYDTEVDYEYVMSWSLRATESTFLQIKGTELGCPMHRNQSNGEGASECTLVGPALLRLMTEGPVLDHLFFKDVSSRCYRHLLELLAGYDASSRRCPWDNLKKLTLHFAEEYSYPHVVVTGPESIDVPPCITSLDLELPHPTSVEIGSSSSPLLIQPSTLERLISFSLKWNWYKHDGNVLLAALAHCPNLETLGLNFRSCRWRCTKPSEVVKLPKLRNLELVKPQEESIKFLNFIETPALTHLDIHIQAEVRPDTLSSFITKEVTRSQGTLHVSLRVSHHPSQKKWDVPEFLTHVPHVTRLILDHCISPPKDLKNIENGPNFFYSLPWHARTLADLKVLEIFGLPPEFPMCWLLKYIGSRQRRRADDGLKTLVIKFGPASLPENCTVRSATVIELMRNAGLSVRAEHPRIVQTDLLDMYK